MLCKIGERFGTPPHVVAGWPASTLRLIEQDVMMTEARQKIGKRAQGG